MFAVFISLIILYPTLLTSQSYNCIFIDTISNNFRLDLSSIADTQLFYYDGSTYNYTYTVCANRLQCNPINGDDAIVSLKQGNQKKDYNQDCWWLLKWDQGAVQPSYDLTKQIWTFKYDNGMPCPNPDDPPRQTTINWHCNLNTPYQITSVANISGCGYEINIDSMYACDDLPPPYCKWFANKNGSSVSLDLNQLTNTTITALNEQNTDIVFAYTPCRNATRCGHYGNGYVMAKTEDITTGYDCDRYLALWDNDNNGGIPEYENGVWKFEYTNGEDCGEFSPNLFIYWECDPNVAMYRVDKANIVETCLYELYISSSLACV